jgi:hypothetical protein
MSKLENIRAISTWRDLFEGQLQHLAIVFLMTLGAISLLTNPNDAPRLLQLTSYDWAIVSIALALIHQIIVALVFRAQLHHKALTRMFKKNDMPIWAAIFMPLLVARPLGLIMVGWADTTSISGQRVLEIVSGVALLIIAIWAMHSVLVYFTLPRALGGDHFRDDYAAMPLVREGAFKYTTNAMYGVVFLGLWGIALAFGS